MSDDQATARDTWRVDVAGVSCYVRGEHVKDHLELINSQLARMTMALHRISKMHPSGPGAGNVAREALHDV